MTLDSISIALSLTLFGPACDADDGRLSYPSFDRRS